MAYRYRRALFITLVISAAATALLARDLKRDPAEPAASGIKVVVNPDASVRLPGMVVPYSTFASPEAEVAFLGLGRIVKVLATAKTIDDQRRTFADLLQAPLERAKALYPVDTEAKILAGVYTDVITPRDGVSDRNKHRVLINLHGGGFTVGARVMGALESIPVASVGKIKVISVDYRLAPEYKFPAASEDVAKVYEELLKEYKPQDIGIYGCSAGGVLTAEATAWIASKNLPRPGAIGMFCGAAAGWMGGDSGLIAVTLSGVEPSPNDSTGPHPSLSNVPYFSEADIDDPLVEPIHSPTVLAQFPPSLIITSTRDASMSSAVYTHAQLVKLGVPADLHVWEGMTHGFFALNPDLPESKEVFSVVTKFFDSHLGSG